MMKGRITIAFAIILAGIIIAGAVFYSIRGKNPTGLFHRTSVRPVSSSDHILGNPLAPIQIIEYVDFESAESSSVNDTLQQIVANVGNGSNVALVLREFPGTTTPASLEDAEAAECVAQTSADDTIFWNFVSELFQNAPNSPTNYGALAAQAGLDNTSGFASCYASIPDTITESIDADVNEAKKLGAQRAPLSVVLSPNKSPIISLGIYPYDAIKAVIDNLLGNNTSQSVTSE